MLGYRSRDGRSIVFEAEVASPKGTLTFWYRLSAEGFPDGASLDAGNVLQKIGDLLGRIEAQDEKIALLEKENALLVEKSKSHRDQTGDPETMTSLRRECGAWHETARQAQVNADYYRGLLECIGKLLGPAAYTSDDGTVHQDVLAVKLPELVGELVAKMNLARKDAEQPHIIWIQCNQPVDIKSVLASLASRAAGPVNNTSTESSQ